MRILFIPVALCAALAAIPACAQQNPEGLARPGTASIHDEFMPLKPGALRFDGGMIGERFAASEANRMLKVDENDLLDCFEQRLKPHQDWQGEHAGKFLHAATLTWADTGDAALRAKIDRVVARLLKTQEADGYLGTYMPAHRWTSWDVWVHKYCLIGLLTYHQYTGSKPALAACRRIGDLLINTFGVGKRDINRAGEHMGMAADSVLEPVTLLYRATGDPHYLQFAKYIVSNYDAPGGPAILASLEKFHSVRRVANGKAYEMTSNFNGMLDLYRITGDRRLLNDMEIAWKDIVDHRLYLTGSASSYEVFQEDNQMPDGQRSNICETCVTVTWEQMNLQLLRLTGDAKYADQLERSLYNHLMAAQKPTGDDWCYYTPLEGHKQYDSATTCCHSSGPRGIALLPEFADMISSDGGLVINLYNSGTVNVNLPKVGSVRVIQQTSYPLDGVVNFTIEPARSGAQFPIQLRIPASDPAGRQVRLLVNGKDVPTEIKSGGSACYLTFTRPWRKGDRLTLELPIETRLVMGGNADEGRAAIVRGPLVLALDSELNAGIGRLNRVALASDDVSKLDLKLESSRSLPGAPVFSVLADGAPGAGATRLYLAPFATAGEDGKSQYSVWIARKGRAAAAAGAVSLFSGCRYRASREGNHPGDITDDDPDSFIVTYNAAGAERDWYEVSANSPIAISRVVYMHGHSFHDGGWFDASKYKPYVEARLTAGGDWVRLGTLAGYPNTTRTDPAGLQDGQRFEVRFAPVKAVAIRVVGEPASGDNPAQAFSSCAELEGFR